MKRAKEFSGDVLDLCPVRLFGGFVCVDFHIGCYGCRYCLNRRSALHARVLDNGIHFDLSAIGVTVADVAALVDACWSYSRAGLPLRIGHGTDWRYQTAATARFVDELPADRAVVVMTRFPLNGARRALVHGQPNLLVHVTLTPAIPGCEAEFVEPAAVLETIAGLPPENLFFMCRPLVAGNGRRNEALVDLLPPGARVGFQFVSTDGIPGARGLTPIAPAEMSALRRRARARGLVVLDYFGCVLWERLGPFFKYPFAAAVADGHCVECAGAARCRSVEPPGETTVTNLVRELGLAPESVRRDGKSIVVQTQTPASRADETYLSQMAGVPIILSSGPVSADPGTRLLPASVFARWENTGFAPVAAMRDLAERIWSHLGPP